MIHCTCVLYDGRNSVEVGTVYKSIFENILLPGTYRGADKSLASPTSRYIFFYGENISFDASLVIYIVLIFLQL
jgi:hypothetical protein